MAPYDDLQIFTSLRYDPQCAEFEPENGSFYLLHCHRDRLVEAAQYFGFSSTVDRLEGTQGLQWLKDRLDEKIKDWQRKNSSGTSGDEPQKVCQSSLSVKDESHFKCSG